MAFRGEILFVALRGRNSRVVVRQLNADLSFRLVFCVQSSNGKSSVGGTHFHPFTPTGVTRRQTGSHSASSPHQSHSSETNRCQFRPSNTPQSSRVKHCPIRSSIILCVAYRWDSSVKVSWRWKRRRATFVRRTTRHLSPFMMKSLCSKSDQRSTSTPATIQFQARHNARPTPNFTMPANNWRFLFYCCFGQRKAEYRSFY